MKSIELLKQEHQNILALLDGMQNTCCRILDGAAVEPDDFYDMIKIARCYADRLHHGKEEQLLFQAMTERLGPAAVKVISHGMLVEHDLGRLHIAELEHALKAYQAAPCTKHKLRILTEASGYVNLLRRHIDKEDTAVYPLAEQKLPESVLQDIDRRTEIFERDAAAQREESLLLLKKIVKKQAVNF